MKKNIRFLISAAAFLLVFGLLFAPLKELVCRKSLTGTWDMTNNIGGFYNEPKDSFEVMYFGTSHAYAAFSPLRIWEKTGVKSYVFATQRQPLWATYAYMVDALKTQSPALAVVDCRGALEPSEGLYDDGVTYSFMDDLPFSWNKVRLAWVSAETMEGRAELLCNFVKYHGRWTDLTETDYTFDRSALRDPYRGYVFLPVKEEVFHRPVIEGIADSAPLDGKNGYWLRKIIELCQKRGVGLWLVKTPSNLGAAEKKLVNTVERIAAEYGVPFDDFNERYTEIGLSPELFFDAHHMDARGAAKFTDFFVTELAARYPALAADPQDAAWAADADAYEAALQALAQP